MNDEESSFSHKWCLTPGTGVRRAQFHGIFPRPTIGTDPIKERRRQDRDRAEWESLSDTQRERVRRIWRTWAKIRGFGLTWTDVSIPPKDAGRPVRSKGRVVGWKL